MTQSVMKASIRTGLVAGVVVIILALSGVFATFQGRLVIDTWLTLETVTLLLMFAVPAFVTVLWNRSATYASRMVQGVTASLIVAMGLVALIVLELVVPYDALKFIFVNWSPLVGSAVTLGYSGDQTLIPGILLMLVTAIVTGALAASLAGARGRARIALVVAILLTVIAGLLEQHIETVLTLADALAVVLAGVAGYLLARSLRLPPGRVWTVAFLGGALVGLFFAAIVASGGLAEGGLLRFNVRTEPVILGAFVDAPWLPLALIFGLVGLAGAMAASAGQLVHDGTLYLLAGALILGVVNAQGGMTNLSALVSLAVLAGVVWFMPLLRRPSLDRYQELTQIQQKGVNRFAAFGAMALVLLVPLFLGQYITNVLDLVLLYIIMGIGLNVMVGFAGLLDLGYVASFAIGAYTAALLMTPSIVTTGCIAPDVSVTDYSSMCVGIFQSWPGIGVFTFWQAWPFAILFSALTGMALGVPVLGLRGDYLAIVTLGFGEITRVITRAGITKPLLGAAQGVSPIPVAVIDLSFIHPALVVEFNSASSIYYLYLFGVVVAAFVVLRLAGARLGRAWRAIRADEDVAEAMGVHLVRTKLLAFGVSSAFAGMGGAIFAAQLRGIFPDSFTLMVSINVLSLIIIGGLGSIPGVIVGALVLVGLPEALRELQDYRLLAFGVLLVITMLVRPAGLIPPPIRQLSLKARNRAESVPESAAVVTNGGTD
jgi:ABC-type branched-subunit amino acid transport system permease subunit